MGDSRTESQVAFKGQNGDVSRSIDWYAEGQTRVVEVDGVRVVVHVIGRKGRKTRIEIVAPAGAVFRESQLRS